MSLSVPPVVVAIDRPNLAVALALASRLDPALCRLKVGMELFTAAGPAAVEALQKLGFEVFLDLKFHDIPNTVAGAVAEAGRVAAAGGRDAVEGGEQASGHRDEQVHDAVRQVAVVHRAA